MSDLISRNALINVLKERATNESIAGYMTAYDVTNSIIDEVEEQPTAYDIDKVVEELQKIEEHCIAVYDWQGQSAIDDAIEIVKQEAEQFGRDTNVGSNGWIPCSERLPEECIEVLVSVKEIDDSFYTITSWVQDGAWVIKKTPLQPTVIAWQPLPQPYTKGE